LAPELIAAQQSRKDLFDHFWPTELSNPGPQHFVHRPRGGVHHGAAGELLAEHSAKDRRAAQSAKAFRPSPPHPVIVEQHPLDAALVIKLGVDAVVPQRGDELVAPRVDPGPQACAKIVHLHGNAPFLRT
jgi:hypothetical protein